jgi:hypothetical protein
LEKVADDLVEMGKLIAREGEERLGAFPQRGDRREHRQGSKPPVRQRLCEIARRVHSHGIIARRVLDALRAVSDNPDASPAQSRA